jgi:hypothetical protein
VRPALAHGAASHGEEVIKHIAVAFALALLTPITAHAQSLGRFFFTPAERAELDSNRVQKKQTPAPPAIAEARPESARLPQTVTYEGIVRRSDGRSMLWMNDHMAEEKEALAGLNLRGKVNADGTVLLDIPGGPDIQMKVGQSVQLHTRKVVERARKE